MRAATFCLVTVLLGLALSRVSGADPYLYYAHKLPQPKAATDFTLTNQDGKPFSLSSLHGKFVLIVFGFTHCANTCPTTLANLASLYNLLSPEEQARVQVVFVTVDPQRDTAKVLKDYVPFFEKRFIALTGTADQIATAANVFGVIYERNSPPTGKGSDSYSFDHSTAVFLIAPSGEWVGYYREWDLRNSARMKDDLEHFLALEPQGESGWQGEKKGVVKTPVPTGRDLYVEQCASCHLENGRGIEGKYPSLVGSPWVLGAPNRLTVLVLDGVKGGHDAKGQQYSGVMPAWRTALPPAYTALLLTYIRQSWGNHASEIAASYVQNLSYQFARQAEFRSWKELEAIPPDTAAKESPTPKASQ